MFGKKSFLSFKNLGQFTWQSWLAQYKMFVILLAPLFLLFIFMAVRFSLKNSQAEALFLKAEKVYNEFNTLSTFKSDTFISLKEVLKKHPQLKASYEASALQKMIAYGKKEEAQGWISSFTQRLLAHPSSYYTQFANTTLKIEKGDIGSSLQEALALKENMLADAPFWGLSRERRFGSTLFAFNLLRVAMLCQALGKNEEELVAWRELKQYAKWDVEEDKNLASFNEGAFSELLQHFSSQNTSLKEYIKYREAKILAGRV